jgi:hypothetical protein
MQVTQSSPTVWLVREAGPLPMGQSETSGVAVYSHSWGWKCEEHGSMINTTKSECEHVAAVKRKVA